MLVKRLHRSPFLILQSVWIGYSVRAIVLPQLQSNLELFYHRERRERREREEERDSINSLIDAD
ncbi:hypothetical protein [Microcoleus anatoxicus]|uniref:Secreted protein n=1 Tax=Microcoleus anatoxicus PTRS2 TaxID=2705321 RepID=A0ABU8YWG3_9CYAN